MEIKFIVSLLPVLLYLFFRTKKPLHMLQQNWYNLDNRYLSWLSKNYKKIVISLDLLFILFILFKFINVELAMILVIIFYSILSLLYLKNNKLVMVKKPLVYTNRVKRMVKTTYLIHIVVIAFMYINFNETNVYLYYIIIGAMIYFEYLIVLLAKLINTPIEKYINYTFKAKALKTLKNSSLDVIGITGSYGKTSSKNILNDVLNIKYNSFATPGNRNTPLGIIRTINEDLDKFNDYFLAEMGAFKMGSIKELCDLVKPKYGILTIIGEAHLESFGSRKNIQSGKFELIESLPLDGIGILNKDDEYQVKYKLKNKCKIVWVGIDNKTADFVASSIKITASGTTFDLSIKNDKKKYSFETKLLGRANIYNILASIALGYELGLDIKQLQTGVKKVRAVEHRLELKEYKGMTLLDDAYNANPVGCKMALDVLNLMKGKKIIITSGMIELGKDSYKLNKILGEQIAAVSDEVILMGKDQTKPIYDGLISKKFKKKNIYILDDIMEAFRLTEKLKEKETYILVGSDLPDMFNEV